VQTVHDATRHLDRLTTEYLTCATISGPLHQVSYSSTILVVARHTVSATYTPRDKQTWFFNETKVKEK
jgi:hypothetical protein